MRLITRQEAQAIRDRAIYLAAMHVQCQRLFYVDACSQLAVAADTLDAYLCSTTTYRPGWCEEIGEIEIEGPAFDAERSDWTEAELGTLGKRLMAAVHAVPRETWREAHLAVERQVARLLTMQIRERVDFAAKEQAAADGTGPQPPETEATGQEDGTDAPTGATE